MFRVQAPYGVGVRSIEQIGRSSKNLNSGDTFVVFAENGPKFGFVWRGAGSNDVEFNAGKQLLDSFSVKAQTKVELVEGAENGDFWISVKGKGDYSKIKEQLTVSNGFEPRLFEVSNSSGYTYMKQVPAYT